MHAPFCTIAPSRLGLNAHGCRTAKTYYAKAVDLTAGGSLRALYGLAACAANLTEKVTGPNVFFGKCIGSRVSGGPTQASCTTLRVAP